MEIAKFLIGLVAGAICMGIVLDFTVFAELKQALNLLQKADEINQKTIESLLRLNKSLCEQLTEKAHASSTETTLGEIGREMGC